MAYPTPTPPPGAGPPHSYLEQLEQQLHDLMMEHARLREELEDRFGRVRQIEDRFLGLRPKADHSTQRELRKRMVLARPWREELAQAYHELLGTTERLRDVTRRIHDVQLQAARVAAQSGGPSPAGPSGRSSPPPPPPPGSW
jgi:predicted nuclease with TOPRIM domain